MTLLEFCDRHPFLTFIVLFIIADVIVSVMGKTP
jgi:hypothetical protein